MVNWEQVEWEEYPMDPRLPKRSGRHDYGNRKESFVNWCGFSRGNSRGGGGKFGGHYQEIGKKMLPKEKRCGKEADLADRACGLNQDQKKKKKKTTQKP